MPNYMTVNPLLTPTPIHDYILGTSHTQPQIGEPPPTRPKLPHIHATWFTLKSEEPIRIARLTYYLQPINLAHRTKGNRRSRPLSPLIQAPHMYPIIQCPILPFPSFHATSKYKVMQSPALPTIHATNTTTLYLTHSHHIKAPLLILIHTISQCLILANSTLQKRKHTTIPNSNPQSRCATLAR